MPLLSAEQLDVVISTLLQATGASLEDARVVARHCVKANLAGHDSHGVIRVPDYIDNIKNGDTVPNAEIIPIIATTTKSSTKLNPELLVIIILFLQKKFIQSKLYL